MKTIGLVMLALALTSGCSQLAPAEIKKCEDYVLGKLRSPSTYKRIKADSAGSPYGKPTHWSVLIEYDAANAYGTPIRDTQVCLFPIKDGKPDTSGYIDFDSRFEQEADNLVSVTDNLTAE